MELTFNKTGELYVAEFKADKEFSLHIERMNGLGSIKMQQNGAEGGKYADVEDFEASNSTKPVIEYDSGAFVAPKWIRIESSVLPTYAAITTEGDVVEIKSQVKSIEITSNGTTSVEPDAGFSYLSKVDVKVDVPTSGEGGGIEYLDVSELLTNLENNPNAVIILSAATQVKCTYNGILMAGPLYAIASLFRGDFSAMATSTTQICVDWSMKLSVMGELQPILNQVLSKITQEELNALPRLTEEEFYNLES